MEGICVTRGVVGVGVGLGLGLGTGTACLPAAGSAGSRAAERVLVRSLVLCACASALSPAAAEAPSAPDAPFSGAAAPGAAAPGVAEGNTAEVGVPAVLPASSAWRSCSFSLLRPATCSASPARSPCTCASCSCSISAHLMYL